MFAANILAGMIHFITPRNRHLYTDVLLDMHRQRKAIFVDELRWPLTVGEDGGEYDEYDDERAMYLAGLDDDRRVEVAMRVRPTDDGKCMIANHFGHLVGPDEPSICDPGVWEGSRIMATPALRQSPDAKRRRHELQLATIEAANLHGIERVIGMIDVFWLTKIGNALWRTRLIGAPAAHAGGEVVAFKIDCSADAVREGRERLQMAQALYELGPSGIG